MMDHLSTEVRYTLLSVFAALVVASATTIAMAIRRRDRDYSLLRSRIRTWWMITGLFALALALSPTAAVWLLACVSFLALKEFMSMSPTRRADRRVIAYAYLAIIGQYYFAATGWYGMFIMFIPVVLFVILPTRMIMIGQAEGFLRAAGTLHWGLMITVFAVSHAAFLLVFSPSESPRLPGSFPSEVAAAFPGPGLLLFLILLTELNGIFQYLVTQHIVPLMRLEKALPKENGVQDEDHRLFSPDKTYPGVIGAVACTALVAGLLGPYLTLMDAPRSLIAGLIISVTGFASQLSIRAIKRDLKIDNFGATLPGHGGVLDRIDSLIFTAPLFFHFVYFYYG